MLRWAKRIKCGCFAGSLTSAFIGCATPQSNYVVTEASPIVTSKSSNLFTPVPGPTRLQQPTNVVLASNKLPGFDSLKDFAQLKLSADSVDPLPSPRPVLPSDVNIQTTTNELTLDQAINMTLLADPQIRAGFEAINQANADVLTATLRPNPELLVGQTLLPLTRPFTEEEQGGPPQLDVFVTYPIDWWLFGKRAAEMASAARGVRVSEAEFANLIRERVVETAVAFFDVVEADGLLEVARLDVETLEQIEERLRQAVEAGGLPRVELDRIRIELLGSHVELREAEAARTAAVARLRSLMGYTQADPAFEVAPLRLEESLPPDPPEVEESLTIALENRPDLEALRRRVDQARADTLVEYRNAYPEVRSQLGYTRQFQQRAIGMPDASSWGVGVEMTLPIFDRNQGNRLRAASVLAQTRFELQAGLVELRAEVETATAELRAARANTELISREQLQLATDIRDSISKAVEIGGRPVIDILDAQRTFRETYRAYTTTRANYWRALYRFQGTLGQQVRPHDGHKYKSPTQSADPRR
jgi:cobalt-zinc-cadmium efflux system outer membrane protein